MGQPTFRALTEAEARALAEDLVLQGRARRLGFVAPGAAVDLARADWTPAADGTYEIAALPPVAEAALRDALARLGDALDLRLVRHGPRGAGLPPAKGVGFTVDLSRDWRSSDGGLLLFVDEEGRAEGWRPEPGALTLYDAARPPLLTMVVPGVAKPRVALFGRL
ncbi:MAG TPA: hypothetical protein VF699_12780 [Caulobacteraceae bacterium]